MCPKSKCFCQKQTTFSRNQISMEGNGFRIQKNFEGIQKMWKNFDRPGLKIASPIKSAAAAAKTKNLQAVQATSNILKSKRGGKKLSLIDIHGNALRLRVMHF